MSRTGGRHQISRRTKIATLGAAVAIAAGAVVVVTTTGDDEAYADGVDKSLFVDITKVKPNVKAVQKQGNASRGTFTVNCGTNKNAHFNGDNFIAAPGVENGAQHLHDYVGNLTTDANSSNQSLQAGGTTCKNGDKSAYFWPVIRIDKGEEDVDTCPSVIFKAVKRPGMLGDGVVAQILVQEGQAISFVIRNDIDNHVTNHITTNILDTQQHDTQSFWYNWIAKSKYKGRWREVVARSLLILKLMTYEPTGAIIASPTFSIPEDIGGVRLACLSLQPVAPFYVKKISHLS